LLIYNPPLNLNKSSRAGTARNNKNEIYIQDLLK